MAAERETDNAHLDATERGEWTIRDEDARRYVHRAVHATASLVESTYGPVGMEKLIVSRDKQNREELVRVDDAGRLLDAIERGRGFNHPVAALLVDGVDGMRSGLRDGTTAAVLLIGAFLEEGFELVEQGLAPSSVVIGYGIARARAGRVLDDLARPVDVGDRKTLADVAATTMTTNLDGADRRRLVDGIAETVARLAERGDEGWIDADDAKVLAKPGAETTVHDGLILSQPDDADPNGKGVVEPIDDATVAIVDREIDFEETASVLDGGDGVRLDSPEAARRYRSGLDARSESAAEELADRGVDVLVCMEKLDELIVRSFQSAGLAVVDKAKYPKTDVYRLARATGGTAVSNLRDLTEDRLGHADRVGERRVGDEVWTVFEGNTGPVYTLVAGAATEEGARLREATVKDALETATVAARDRQVLPGAGAPAAAVASALRDGMTDVSGREQLAVQAFAEALECLPATLACNAGHDPVESLTALRAAHADGRSMAGVDPANGKPLDAWAAGIVEPRRVFSQAIETAATVTERLLTIDAVLYPNVEFPEYTPRPERN